MTRVSRRLNVEGPDSDGDFELCLEVDGRDEYHYITRAEAVALVQALQVALEPTQPVPARLTDSEQGKALGSAAEGLSSSVSKDETA